MGPFLASLPPRDPPLRYFCVDPSPTILQLAESRAPPLRGVSANYILRKFWRLPMPRADLVFVWGGLAEMHVENVESFLKIVGEGGRHRLMLVGSMPGVRNGEGGFNVRRKPFGYGLPKRIFKKLAVTDSLDGPEKHMYLYETADMGR